MNLRRHPDVSLPAPSVTILIKGQLLLRPNANSTACRISVNADTSYPHRLAFIVDAILPDGTRVNPPLVALPGPLEDNISIEVTPNSRGVFGFVVGDPSADFNRFAGGNDSKDIRWAIDLQNPREFHPAAPDLICTAEDQYGIIVKDGIFHCVDRSSAATLFVQRRRASDIRQMNRIGTIIGNIINLQGGEHVSISWRQAGQARTLALPRPPATDPPGTYYAVSIRNDPDSITAETTHDELSEYYRVLRKPPKGDPFLENEQFKLDMVQLDAHDGDRIPCMSVFLGE